MLAHTALNNSIDDNENLGPIDLNVPLESFDEFDLLLLINIYNGEGDYAFYNEILDNYEYEKADNIDYYSKGQQEIIYALKDGTFFDKSKPYKYAIGAKYV